MERATKMEISASEQAMLLELASCHKVPRPIRGANFKKWTYTGSDSNSSALSYLKFAENEPEERETNTTGKREVGHSESEQSMRHLDFLKELERTKKLKQELQLSRPIPEQPIPNKKSYPTEPPGFESPTIQRTCTMRTRSQSRRTQNQPPKTSISEQPKSPPQWSNVPTMARSGLKRKQPAQIFTAQKPVIVEDEQVWCQLCKVVCSSGYNMQQHVRGRAHKARVEWNTKGKNVAIGGNHYDCDVCGVRCSDKDGLGMHLKGKKHKEKVLEDADRKKMVRCEVCGVQCMNEDSFRQHLNGRQHARKQQRN